MTVKVIKLENAADELSEFMKASVEEYKRAVVSGLARSIPQLVQDSPVDTGLYAQSWAFTATETEAVIGNYAPHAAIIEHGTRPFTPPIAPLLAWAKRVLKDGSQPPNYSDRVWALAKATQKKIAAEGIAPRHVLERNIPNIIENIKKELAGG
jgi:hypothetical protein